MPRTSGAVAVRSWLHLTISIPVTDDQGDPVMTENYTLQKFVITGRHKIFWVRKPNNKEIVRPDVTVNNLTADDSDYRPPNSDFSFSGHMMRMCSVVTQ